MIVFVDAIEIASAADSRESRRSIVERLKALAELFAGDFLDGLELDRSPHFDSWLIAQRRRFSACHAALLEHLVGKPPGGSDEVLPHLENWARTRAVRRTRAHVCCSTALAERGQIRRMRGTPCRDGAAVCSRGAGLRAHSRGMGGAEEPADGRTALRARGSRLARVACTAIEPCRAGAAASRRASLAVMPFLEERGSAAASAAASPMA